MQIEDQIHISARESNKGVIWFTRQSLVKIARMMGFAYNDLSEIGKVSFRSDCVDVVGFPNDRNMRTPKHYLGIN